MAEQEFRKIKVRSAQVQLEGANFTVHNSHLQFNLEHIRIDLFSDFELVASFHITDRAAVNHTHFHDSIVISNPDHATSFCLQFFSGPDKVLFVHHYADLIQFFKAKRRSIELQEQARELLGRKFAVPARRANGGIILSPNDQSPQRTSGGSEKRRPLRNGDKNDDDESEEGSPAQAVSSSSGLRDVDRLIAELNGQSRDATTSNLLGGEDDDPHAERRSGAVMLHPPDDALPPTLTSSSWADTTVQQPSQLADYSADHGFSHQRQYQRHQAAADGANIFRDAYRYPQTTAPVVNRNFQRPFMHSPAMLDLPYQQKHPRFHNPNFLDGSSFFVDPVSTSRETLMCRWCHKLMESFEHERRCEWRVEPCHDCGAKIEAKLLSAHQCPARRISAKVHLDHMIESDALRKAKELLERLERARSEPPRTPPMQQQQSLQYSMPPALATPRATLGTVPAVPSFRPQPQRMASLGSFAELPSSATRKGSVVHESKQRRCVWCNNPAPEVHDAQCNFRKLRCKRCGNQIYFKDKQTHRTQCPNRN